jgi:hypothetical protein
VQPRGYIPLRDAQLRRTPPPAEAQGVMAHTFISSRRASNVPSSQSRPF